MKKVITIILTAAAFFTLSACAVSAPTGWHKEGVSNYEIENAIAQCEYEKDKDHVETGDFVSNCMKRQGFRWY